MDCIKEQQVFTKYQRAKWDPNHKRILNAPPNQKIRVNLVFAVKYNGRHKARLVADGSLTPEPAENIYSGVVSLRHLRLIIFLGELNNLELWGADIGNAYLETYTNEKLFIIGGAEFEELEGFILIFMVSNQVAKGGQKSSMISSRTCVEKPQFLIGLISSCPDQFNSCALLKSKIACLHVSLTTFEYFYKLSKSASFSRWLLHLVTQKNQ